MSERVSRVARIVSLSVMGLAFVSVAVVLLALPDSVVHFFSLSEIQAGETKPQESAELIFDAKGAPGLKLTPPAVAGLGIKPVQVISASKSRPLPPQPGTVNFDIDGMFPVRSRFNGELVEITKVPDQENPSPGKTRMLKWGDKVKQDDLLAVVWSVDLGTAKAALVDALCSLKLSQDALERQRDLWKNGGTSIAQLKQTERQVEADKLAYFSAERKLYTWKVDEDEIKKIKQEAERIGGMILENKDIRDPAEEAKRWARVEVRLQKSGRDSNRELVIVEKNTNIGDFVDPGKDPPLFRVADMNRLMIWVHPPEEYLPMLRGMLEKGPGQWFIQFQTDPPGTPPVAMEFVQISPSLEPNQHTPMLIGYLNNSGGNRYTVGQFVTATIMVPPEPDTVEIPTEAIDEIGGQSLVFVQPDPAKSEFFQRRVSVVQRFRDKSIVRTKLTKEDEALSKADVDKGRLPILPLEPKELVVTRGIIELMAELDSHLAALEEKDN
jgi:membrane fusion protein, heavy metal efflux system